MEIEIKRILNGFTVTVRAKSFDSAYTTYCKTIEEAHAYAKEVLDTDLKRWQENE